MCKITKFKRFKRKRYYTPAFKYIELRYQPYTAEKTEELRKGLEFILPKLSFTPGVTHDVQ